jgi:hypothetical protein
MQVGYKIGETPVFRKLGKTLASDTSKMGENKNRAGGMRD